MKMRRSFVAVIFALFPALLQFSLTLGSTVPAFMWSPHADMSQAVNYQTIAPRDLGKFILSDGGWSDLLCAGRSSHLPIDVAFVFVGKEQSSDVATNSFLKDSLSKSNFSMAFPYVEATNEKGQMEHSLLADFEETCGNGMGLDNVILVGSCSVVGTNYKRVADLDSINDHLIKGVRNLVVYCHGDSNPSDQTHSESDVLANVITSAEQAGLKYSALYVSNPYNFIEYPSHLHMERLLAQAFPGNASSNSTCDGVCQIKTNLLEALFTAIVLLIILISGLCCMMGIDTPTRFEAPQDS